MCNSILLNFKLKNRGGLLCSHDQGTHESLSNFPFSLPYDGFSDESYELSVLYFSFVFMVGVNCQREAASQFSNGRTHDATQPRRETDGAYP